MGNITSNIRAVVLGWEDKKIYLKFITFKFPIEDDKKSLSLMGTEMAADFPEKDILESIEKSDLYPKDLIDNTYKHFIYLRSS